MRRIALHKGDALLPLPITEVLHLYGGKLVATFSQNYDWIIIVIFKVTEQDPRMLYPWAFNSSYMN